VAASGNLVDVNRHSDAVVNPDARVASDIGFVDKISDSTAAAQMAVDTTTRAAPQDVSLGCREL
jgi:hypothetical protein